MHAHPTSLPGVLLLEAAPHVDHRGGFVETWAAAWDAALPAGTRFERDGQAWNPVAGTMRGLHAQHALGKLVRLAHGAVFDVVVDLRPGSPAWGRHVAVTLDGRSGTALWVPAGCAHGYLTLSEDAVVTYRFTGQHVPGDELGVRWDDPELGIAWPRPPALVSERDRALPLLADLRALVSAAPLRPGWP